MQKTTGRVLLYDFERDKDLQPGQVILIFENGTTKRAREESLYEKEAVSVRKPAKLQQSSSVRSRSTRAIKHRAQHTKRHASRKRAAIYQA